MVQNDLQQSRKLNDIIQTDQLDINDFRLNIVVK